MAGDVLRLRSRHMEPLKIHERASRRRVEYTPKPHPMIQRKAFLKRSTQPLKRTPLKRAKPKRRKEKAEYARAEAIYLAAHPFCQIQIAMRGANERSVIENGGWDGDVRIARSTQVHHRNKRDSARLLDERWWMSAGFASHIIVESRKNWSRSEGYLLPIQADADGRWGDGNQALETPAFMASKVRAE